MVLMAVNIHSTEAPWDPVRTFLGAKLPLLGTRFMWDNGNSVPFPDSADSFWNTDAGINESCSCMNFKFKGRTPSSGWKNENCFTKVANAVCELKPLKHSIQVP